MKQFLIICLSLGILTSCAKTDTITVKEYIVPEIQIVNRPRPIKIEPVSSVLLTREEMTKRLSDAEFRTLVGVSTEDYQKLINNVVDATRYIKMQNKIISYYENTIKELSTNESEPGNIVTGKQIGRAHV